jgi:single-strand DNA-binding protein
MSGSVNKVILIGRLGKDPEARHTNSGALVVSFSLATSETWRDKTSGERMERTEWHNVVIFNEPLGKIAEQYLKKGAAVYVEGKMRTREYTDRDGNARKSTEVVLEQFRGELTLLASQQRAAPDPDSYGATKPKPDQTRPNQNQIDDPRQTMRTADRIDDDIPF